MNVTESNGSVQISLTLNEVIYCMTFTVFVKLDDGTATSKLLVMLQYFNNISMYKHSCNLVQLYIKSSMYKCPTLVHKLEFF